MANFNPPYAWTIMIYMASNEKYSEAAARKFLKELNALGTEIDKRGKKGKVKIMLQSMGNWNPSGRTKAYYSRLYEIQTNFLTRKRVNLDIINANMGDRQTLSDFIGICRETSPAKKYMLFLWGHGTGVGMFDYELKESKSNIKYLKKVSEAVIHQPPSKLEDDIFDDRIMERQIINTKEKNPTNLFYFNVSKHREVKKYLPSAVRLDSLTSTEIRDSLRVNFSKHGGKIDIVTILGCAMQMIEFGYEIRKYCKYFVASEELMFWEGYNYKKTFARLFRNPGLDARALGRSLIRDATLKPGYTKNDKREIAISCVDLGQSAALAKQISAISKSILVTLKRDPLILDLVADARLKCYHFGEKSFDSYIDATWFFKCLAGRLRNRKKFSNIYQKSVLLVKFLKENYILEKYIGVDRRPISGAMSSHGGHGVSIYFPYGKKDERDNEDRRFPFRKDSPFKVKFVNNAWNDLVAEFMKFLKGNPQASDNRL